MQLMHVFKYHLALGQWPSHLLCMQLPTEVKTQISGPITRFPGSVSGVGISNKFPSDADTVCQGVTL